MNSSWIHYRYTIDTLYILSDIFLFLFLFLFLLLILGLERILFLKRVIGRGVVGGKPSFRKWALHTMTWTFYVV